MHKVNSTETTSGPDNLGRSNAYDAPHAHRTSALKRSLITAFCLFHMGAVVVFNLPQNTALGDLRAPLAWYAGISWINQEWGMFTTIPHYAELRPVLVAKYSDAVDTTHGPMLPGLAAYPEDLRSLYLVLHTLWPTGEYLGLAHGYLQNTCDAIARQTGKRPTSVALRVDAKVLSPLDRVRRSRAVGRPERQWSGAAQCR